MVIRADASEAQPIRDADDLRIEARVASILKQMTIREKAAQLYGIWVGAATDGGDVAPLQHDLSDDVRLDELLPYGLGQLTRPFGSAPIDPAVGSMSLARTQRRIMAESRFGIPAIAHEECLAGFTAWGATAYPIPLAWGATFDPDLIRQMAGQIGAGMRSVGVHQGLAPVLDVTRDARWGRTEETIGEDPYLVGSIGSAYVTGLENSGIIATLKHFVGYSASRGSRNLAPVSIGPRERADVLLAPFEMALRETGVRSVMHSYADVDGVPAASDHELLTSLLRQTWSFEGTVVADYFGIAFLKALHGTAGTWGEAAAAALTAGVDVELPSVKTYGMPLIEEVESGRLDESVIDRAVTRVLTQKAHLGMLDPDWSPLPDGWDDSDLNDSDLDDSDLNDMEKVRGRVVLDGPENRALAERVAAESIVLCTNDGTLPLVVGTDGAWPRIALIGPCANDPMALLGCYSFPSHVGAHHPDIPAGIELPTLAESFCREFPQAVVSIDAGCDIDGSDDSGIPAAVRAARGADVTVVALGDRAGLFGRGTSGEGCDAESLRLPGRQQDLLDALLGTGTPVVVVLLAGRPYALGRAPDQAAAIVQTFFPGEAGGAAVAGVLSGRVNPSGRLPVSIPARADAPACTYLGPPLAQTTSVSSIDPAARFAFGHGLSYTTFEWSQLRVNGSKPSDADATAVRTDGRAHISFLVRNLGDRHGAEVVQVYLHDPVASVTRPVIRLIGYLRIEAEPGETVRVEAEVPADLAAFTGRDGRHVVESGDIELRLGASSRDIRLTARLRLVGPERIVDHTRALHCLFTVGHVSGKSPAVERDGMQPVPASAGGR